MRSSSEISDRRYQDRIRDWNDLKGWTIRKKIGVFVAFAVGGSLIQPSCTARFNSEPAAFPPGSVGSELAATRVIGDGCLQKGQIDQGIGGGYWVPVDEKAVEALFGPPNQDGLAPAESQNGLIQKEYGDYLLITVEYKDTQPTSLLVYDQPGDADFGRLAQFKNVNASYTGCKGEWVVQYAQADGVSQMPGEVSEKFNHQDISSLIKAARDTIG